MMPKLLRQPLIHFLALGSMLFFLHFLVGDSDPRQITINKESVLNYIQFQQKAFNQTSASKFLDSLGDAERSRLINDIVREEALYREALALKLDQSDYIIKRRLIQKVEFITRGFSANDSPISRSTSHPTSQPISREDLERFYNKQQDNYQLPPTFSFTHLFFAADQREQQAMELAVSVRDQLNIRKDLENPPEAIVSTADPFFYDSHYEMQTEKVIGGHFGSAFVAQLSRLTPARTWQGPVTSAYGVHLVLLSDKTGPVSPGIDEILEKVTADAVRQRQEMQSEAALDAIVERYKVSIDPSVFTPSK